MKIEKKKIVDLPAVYVTADLNLDKKKYFAVASENRGEHAYIIDAESLEYADMWRGETGVMNIIQIPGYDAALCITKFYPIFQSKEATICLLKPNGKNYVSEWTKKEILLLPFCHRIGIVRSKNGLFLLGCALCEDKDFQDDWSKPGAIWAARVPDNLDSEWHMTKVFEGLTKNHGLFIDDEKYVYITSENGVMKFDFSNYDEGESMFPELISTTPTSDISILHDDSTSYVGTIEPFHGDLLHLYSMNKNRYESIFTRQINFGHVVWVGKIQGKKAIIYGNRGGDKKELAVVFWDSDEVVVLDEQVGPTQITVVHDGNTTKILSANHGAGEVSLYTLS